MSVGATTGPGSYPQLGTGTIAETGLLASKGVLKRMAIGPVHGVAAGCAKAGMLQAMTIAETRRPAICRNPDAVFTKFIL